MSFSAKALRDKSEEKLHRGFRNVFGVDTKVLLDVRDGKVKAYLATIDQEIARLADAKKDGLVMKELSDRRAALAKAHALASMKTLADQKSDALELVKVDAEKLAAEAPGKVGTFLKIWDIADGQRLKAHAVIELAKQHGPGADTLRKPALVLADALAALEAGKTTDCEAAFQAWSQSYEQVREYVDEFRDKHLAPPLLKAAQSAAAAAPAGLEAKMLKLYPDGLSKKMSDMKITALATGADISMLNPAVGAAVAEYTTSAYADINGTLLGLPGQRTPEREAECKLLADIVQDAMKTLVDFQAWPTNRGEKRWNGSEAQYKKGKVFEIKAFWSTGAGFKFDGDIQITVLGRPKQSRGKNVAGFSRFPNEMEVLFPPGTKFRVKSNTTRSDDTSDIVVEEV